MGIRIHKMCGYGLTDLVEDDPRINWGSKYFNYSYSDYDLDEFLEHSKRRDYYLGGLDSIMVRQWRKKGKKDQNPLECAVFGNADMGLENVMCVRPISSPEWHRSDDTLDWLESGGEPDSTVRLLDHGIFPYDGLYMDARTGEHLKNGVDIKRWLRIVGKVGEEARDAIIAGEYAGVFEKATGMDYEEAKEFLVPNVPGDVRNVAEYLGIFATEDAWKDLRPMVYTYWG